MLGVIINLCGGNVLFFHEKFFHTSAFQCSKCMTDAGMSTE